VHVADPTSTSLPDISVCGARRRLKFGCLVLQ
jgi:hypothetical protein